MSEGIKFPERKTQEGLSVQSESDAAKQKRKDALVGDSKKRESDAKQKMEKTPEDLKREGNNRALDERFQELEKKLEKGRLRRESERKELEDMEIVPGKRKPFGRH